jgi:glycogen debranching enzyme
MVKNPGQSLIRLRPRAGSLYVSRNRSVLATELDGFIHGGPEHGLFVHQTRLLSRYRYRVDGHPPHPVAQSNVDLHNWLGYYLISGVGEPGPTDGTGGRPSAPEAAQNAVELRLSRAAGDGLHEDVDMTNFTQQPVSFDLALEIDADFADHQETQGQPRRQTGDLRRDWRSTPEGACELFLDYQAEAAGHESPDGLPPRTHRSARIQFHKSGSTPSYKNRTVHFQIHLPPRGAWHTCVKVIPEIDGERLSPPATCRSFGTSQDALGLKTDLFLEESTAFSNPESPTLGPQVIAALDQARQDVAALRLFDMDHGDRSWIPAAGIPIYVSLFGRDVLTAAWQSALISPALMRGAVAELARWQGTELNDWRDEQPGRMLHEGQTGPLAKLNLIPLDRYYGSVTTSAFYPVVLSELWHWTGDRQAVLPFIEPALKALRWLDRYGDLDSDGFYEYKSRSRLGVKHQAWKDSPDAVVDEDGSPVEPPVATCEEQGFVYMAKLHLAEVLWWLDRRDEAKTLYRQAGELKKRFNEAFWMEDQGFFAFGLDSKKEPIRSVASNPGHCVATAIVDGSLVERTVGRLLADDLFSGWGIRTLSSKNPAYNPYSYHRGSVWPVEQGTFAMGFYRYGLHRPAALLSRAQFEAAALFDFYRLPECFSGHPRDADHPFPAIYPNANSPQAWSSSAVFNLLQALLGLYPYAPLNILLVDPHLPEWLPEITLTNLQVGRAVVHIRFFRTRDGSSDYDVLDVRGPLHVVRQPSPWSLTAGGLERFKDALTSLLPTR